MATSSYDKEREIDKLNKTAAIDFDRDFDFDTADNLVNFCDFTAEDAIIMTMLVKINDELRYLRFK